MSSGKIVVSAVLAAALGCVFAARAVEIGQFPFEKWIEVRRSGDAEMGAFDLDDETFACTEDDYRNMRIFDSDGVEVPFLVRAVTKTESVTQERRITLERVSFEALPDNRAAIVFRRKPDQPVPSAIVFSTALRDYEKKVAVFGNDEIGNWKPVAEASPIFDYSRFIDVRNNRIEMTPRAYAYYRIEVSDITESRQSPLTQIVRDTRSGAVFSELEKKSFSERDFRIDEIAFLERKTVTVKGEKTRRIYAVTNLNVAIEPKGKVTIVAVKTARQPLIALKVATPGCNFSRALSVEGRNEEEAKDEWRRLATGRITKIDAGGYRQESLTIPLAAPQRLCNYRLTIENMDSPPLEISGVEAEGEVHRAFFLGKSGGNMRLLYGGKDIPAPRYDIGFVIEKAEEGAATMCALGNRKSNPDYGQVAAKFRIPGRTVLVVAVVLMVLVLGALIARALRLTGASG